MQRLVLGRVLAAVLFLWTASNVSAQGTAISYQGRLNDGGAPANTNYDFRFAVFDAPTNGNQLSIWLTNSVVPVSNGLFSVTLDFGPGVFNGTDNGSNDWMDVAVRKSGVAAAFTVLVPRQPILPVPYALFATSASNLLGTLQAAQLVGTIASSVFSGAYSNAVNFVNPANLFTGAFSGNGANLTSLNASQITSGTLADAQLQNDVALLDQTQTFTASNTFDGGVAFNGQDTFTGVNNFNNSGNSFTGSFFGNGLVGWTAVSGTSVAAARDHGYLLQNAALTTVSLPASGSLTQVDIIRISGAGAGGWQVQENGAQTIMGNFASLRNSYVGMLPPAASGDAYGVAASADGGRMYVVGNDITGVNESADGGHTWNTIAGTYFSGPCVSVACSANGKIVYAEPYAGNIKKSSDSGLTWVNAGASTSDGLPIACTADGSTLLRDNVTTSGTSAYEARIVNGAISYSVNSGGFNAISGSLPKVNCLAVSSDCQRMVAGSSNGLLYASANFGASWTTLTATNQIWIGAWMSPDGSKFAATARIVPGISGGVSYCNVVPLPTSTTGAISGSQGSAVELQYVGLNLFMPVSSTGLLWAN